MATITIKIDSEQLAREVLTQLGYLPGEDDDIPDLISVASNEEPEDPVTKEPEPVAEEPILVVKPTSSRDAFAEQQIKKVLVDQGLVVAPPVEEWCPKSIDEGFGTPLDQPDMEHFDVVNASWLTHIEQYHRYMKGSDIPAYEGSEIEKAARLVEIENLNMKREQKRLKQEGERDKLAKCKERLHRENYILYLKERLSNEDDKDIKEVLYEFLGDTDADYVKYFEEKDRIPYEQYLNES